MIVNALAAILALLPLPAQAQGFDFGDVLGAIVKEGVEAALETPSDQVGAEIGSLDNFTVDERRQLSNELVAALLDDDLAWRAADASGGKSGTLFRITSAELLDSSIRGESAKADARFEVSPKPSYGT